MRRVGTKSFFICSYSFFIFIFWFILYLHIVFIFSFLFFFLLIWQVIIWRNHDWVSFSIYLYLFYFQVFLSNSVLTVQYAAVRSTLLDLMIFNFFSAVLFFRLLFIFALLTFFLSYFLLFRSKFQTVKAENVFAVMTSLFPLEVKDQKYLKRS